MKKLTLVLIAAFFTCFSSMAFSYPGEAAKSGEEEGSNGFAWGIGLGAAAVVGTVVGLVVTSSTSSPKVSHHSH